MLTVVRAQVLSVTSNQYQDAYLLRYIILYNNKNFIKIFNIIVIIDYNIKERLNY